MTSRANKLISEPSSNEWMKRWRKSGNLERLLAGALAAGLAVLTWCCMKEYWKSAVNHNAAVSFAERLRELEAEARSRNQFVHVEMIPATPARRCAYLATADGKEVDRKEFPDGVFVTGEVTFDPQGVPATATKICFCCGKKREIVQVDVKGLVSMP